MISPTAASQEGRLESSPFEARITSVVSCCWAEEVSSGQAAAPSPEVCARRYDRTVAATCCCVVSCWLGALWVLPHAAIPSTMTHAVLAATAVLLNTDVPWRYRTPVSFSLPEVRVKRDSQSARALGSLRL